MVEIYLLFSDKMEKLLPHRFLVAVGRKPMLGMKLDRPILYRTANVRLSRRKIYAEAELGRQKHGHHSEDGAESGLNRTTHTWISPDQRVRDGCATTTWIPKERRHQAGIAKGTISPSTGRRASSKTSGPTASTPALMGRPGR